MSVIYHDPVSPCRYGPGFLCHPRLCRRYDHPLPPVVVFPPGWDGRLTLTASAPVAVPGFSVDDSTPASSSPAAGG